MNYYDLLDISPSATLDQIKVAYRAKALLLHPDKNADNPESAEQFKSITEAYEVLRNPRKRTAYDLMADGVGTGASTFGYKAPSAWSPEGGDAHFDAWLRRWMRDNGLGPEGQEELRRQRRWAEKTAAWASQTAAWEEEKRESRRQRERDFRMRQKMADRRAARQAAILRNFWQTHHGVTWQDGAYLTAMSALTVISVWLLWPSKPPVKPQSDV